MLPGPPWLLLLLPAAVLMMLVALRPHELPQMASVPKASFGLYGLRCLFEWKTVTVTVRTAV
jgi:hypothetical protein